MSANLFSELSNHEAAQQSPNPMEASAVHSRGSEATPMATGNLVKKQSLHLEEAKEMCPEGHELSESYHPDGVHSTPGGMPPFLKVCQVSEQMFVVATLTSSRSVCIHC